MKKITDKQIEKFDRYLKSEERASATIEKYIRDVRAFSAWLGGEEFDKSAVLAYKNYLIENYAPASVNSMLSSLNSFFAFMDWRDCHVKTLKIQRQIDPTKIHNELGWKPETKFDDGIVKTVEWYLANKVWWEKIISGEYQSYYERMYGGKNGFWG